MSAKRRPELVRLETELEAFRKQLGSAGSDQESRAIAARLVQLCEDAIAQAELWSAACDITNVLAADDSALADDVRRGGPRDEPDPRRAMQEHNVAFVQKVYAELNENTIRRAQRPRFSKLTLRQAILRVKANVHDPRALRTLQSIEEELRPLVGPAAIRDDTT